MPLELQIIRASEFIRLGAHGQHDLAERTKRGDPFRWLAGFSGIKVDSGAELAFELSSVPRGRPTIAQPRKLSGLGLRTATQPSPARDGRKAACKEALPIRSSVPGGTWKGPLPPPTVETVGYSLSPSGLGATQSIENREESPFPPVESGKTTNQ
jgi:hypothetical protein